MGKILKTYIKGKELPEIFDTLIPDKIEVINCNSYPDSTYFETVRFSFTFGTNNGSTPYYSTKKIIELEIETGYLSQETVAKELKSLLSQFNILNLDNLIMAFAYRRYYCTI